MASTPSTGLLRLGFERSVRDIYEQLTSSSDETSAPFKTMKDLFLFAACRGYQLGERRPVQAPKEVVIHWGYFTQDIDIPILKALAIATTGDLSIVVRPQDIATIAEEYANAGIHDIKYALLGQQGQPLWNLVGLVRAEYGS